MEFWTSFYFSAFFYLKLFLPASEPWCTLVQRRDLSSIMTLKSLLWHPGFGEGRGPCRSAQRICPVFLTGFVSVRAGALYLLSAFYFQKRIPCLLVHSRCSVFIQCVKDRKVLGSLKFALGSALLISLYLCRFNSFLSLVDVHMIFKAQSKALRHINKYRFLLSRNSYIRFLQFRVFKIL